MSEAIATREAVEDAATQLRNNGKVPTFSRARDVIGGGSKDTILAHLRALRHAERPSKGDVLPAILLDRARPLLEVIYVAAEACVEGKYAAATDRYHRNMEELEQELDDAHAMEKKLRSDLGAMVVASDALRQENGELRAQFAAQLQRMEALTDRLSRFDVPTGQPNRRRPKKPKSNPSGR